MDRRLVYPVRPRKERVTMLRQIGSSLRIGRIAALAAGALLALASLAAGCGPLAPAIPTPTPVPPTATTRPNGSQLLLVMNEIKGPGVVTRQTQVVAVDPATGHQLWSRALRGYPGPYGLATPWW